MPTTSEFDFLVKDDIETPMLDETEHTASPPTPSRNSDEDDYDYVKGYSQYVLSQPTS